jgi:hypothetical protein
MVIVGPQRGDDPSLLAAFVGENGIPSGYLLDLGCDT